MHKFYSRTWRQLFAAGLTASTLCFTLGSGQLTAYAQDSADKAAQAALENQQAEIARSNGEKPFESTAISQNAPAAVFAGTGVGAIPDGLTGTPPQYGAPLVISFPVTGLTGSPQSVSLDLTLTHTWVGDLDMVLQAPAGGPSFVLVSRIGVTTAAGFGDSSNYSGNYNFIDTAAGTNIWTVATVAACGDTCNLATGNYRTTAAGGAGQTNPPPVTNLSAAFAGLTTAQTNGTWTLTIRDGGNLDTGTVTAANLNITAGPVAVADAPIDMNGDGRTDFVNVRNTGGGAGGQVTWFINENGVVRGSSWGISTDLFFTEDFDGDNKDDVVVWRPGTPNVAGFYIIQSQTNTFRFERFGQTGDDPTIVGDYDGDNKADVAVYRAGAAAGQVSTWFYRPSATPATDFIGVQWGQNGDFPSPGDYDGDGRHDFVVQRNGGGGQARFFLRQTTAGIDYVTWGLPTDVIVPGDYDGDGKCDIAVVRGVGGQLNWFINERDGGTQSYIFGTSATDFVAQGDYNGDGKIDTAVWRPSATPGNSQYFVRPNGTSGASDSTFNFGLQGDFPVANYNRH